MLPPWSDQIQVSHAEGVKDGRQARGFAAAKCCGREKGGEGSCQGSSHLVSSLRVEEAYSPEGKYRVDELNDGTLFSTQRIRLYRLSFASYSLEELQSRCAHML